MQTYTETPQSPKTDKLRRINKNSANTYATKKTQIRHLERERLYAKLIVNLQYRRTMMD